MNYTQIWLCEFIIHYTEQYSTWLLWGTVILNWGQKILICRKSVGILESCMGIVKTDSVIPVLQNYPHDQEVRCKDQSFYLVSIASIQN